MASTGKCVKRCLICFNILLWTSGLILVAVGLWLLFDPRRNFLLHLVHFTQGDPLLRISVYIFVGIGGICVLVGIFGCCAAVKEVRCLLCSYSLLLFLIIAGQMSSGALAYSFQEKMRRELPMHFYNMTHFEYGRLYWVTDIVDRVQYWRKCCGSRGPDDYAQSWYQIHKSGGRPLQVPLSCCVQTIESWPPDQLVAVDQEVCQNFPGIVDGKPNVARHNESCSSSLLEWLDSNCFIVIVLAFTSGSFQIIGLLLSLILCRFSN